MTPSRKRSIEALVRTVRKVRKILEVARELERQDGTDLLPDYDGALNTLDRAADALEFIICLEPANAEG